jgi:hypothetical protein
MSLLLIEGFETAAAANDVDISAFLSRKYGSPITVNSACLSAAGRHFGRSLVFTSPSNPQKMFSTPAFSPVQTIVVGFAFKSSLDGSNNTFDLLRLGDGASSFHLGLRVLNTGAVQVNKNGTILTGESSSDVISPNTWYYVEIKATIHDTTGSYSVRVNGVTVASATNVDTRNVGNESVDRVTFCGQGGFGHQSTFFDDIYVLDTTGSLNDFLGVQVVEAIYPTSEVQGDWTPSTGTDNSAMVDENPMDSDSTYVESSTIGNKDLYGMGNLSQITANVKGVQVNADLRVTDATPFNVELIVKENITESAFANQTVSSESYRTFSNIIENNPDTGLPFTVAEVNAMQCGIELKA